MAKEQKAEVKPLKVLRRQWQNSGDKKLNNERTIEMENTYKFALELILKLCEKESYGSKEDIQTICEMALEIGGEEI